MLEVVKAAIQKSAVKKALGSAKTLAAAHLASYLAGFKLAFWFNKDMATKYIRPGAKP